MNILRINIIRINKNLTKVAKTATRKNKIVIVFKRVRCV